MKKILLTGFALLATTSAWATDYSHCIPKSGMVVGTMPSVTANGKLFVPSFVYGPTIDSFNRSADKEVAVTNLSNTLPNGWNSKFKNTFTLVKADDGKPQYLAAEFNLHYTDKNGKPVKVSESDPFWNPSDATMKTFYKYDQKDLCYVDRTSVVVKGKETVNYDRATCDKVMAAVKGREQVLNQCTSALKKVKQVLDTTKSKFEKEGLDFSMGYMGTPGDIRKYKKGELNDIEVASMAYANCKTVNGFYNPELNFSSMLMGTPMGMSSDWPESDYPGLGKEAK